MTDDLFGENKVNTNSNAGFQEASMAFGRSCYLSQELCGPSEGSFSPEEPKRGGRLGLTLCHPLAGQRAVALQELEGAQLLSLTGLQVC